MGITSKNRILQLDDYRLRTDQVITPVTAKDACVGLFRKAPCTR